MNLQSLSFFVEVTRDMNFTKAAERLNTSQQVLSGHIKRLEEYYGVDLFVRKPKIALTYAGEQLLSSAKKILSDSEEIYDKLYNVSTQKRGRIRVQIAPQRCLAYAPRIFPAFSRLHPRVDIEIIELASTGLAKDNVRNGTADFFLGAVTSDTPDILEKFLYWEYLYVVVSDNLLERYETGLSRKLRGYAQKHGGISAELLKGIPILMHPKSNSLRPYESACFHDAGFEPNIRLETSSTPALYQLAVGEMGAAICSALYVAPEDIPEGISYYPLLYKNELLRYKVNMIYREKAAMPPYMKDFIEIVMDSLSGDEHAPPAVKSR